MNLENKNSFLLSTATTLGFITYIFNTTHSPFNTGAVTIATLLVGMLLGPFLGILVKEKGLMWSMVVPEIVSGFILLIFILDNLYLVYIIAFLIGFNNKILGIARLSFIPNITNDLVKFNALLRSINRFALIGGSLLFSVIINYSLTMVFVIDAITYIISAYLLYQLNRNVKIQSYSTISQKTIRQNIYDRIQLLIKGYKLLFLNKKINFIVYLGILARIFYMCIPILLLIFIKDILHLTDSQYGYTQTISRLASFIVFGILAKYFTINLVTSFKKILFPLFLLYGGSIFCIGYIKTIEELYILYSISEILLFTAVVLVHAYIQSIFSQEELTLASGSVSTGFSIGSILSITIFTSLANVLPLHDIFFICGFGIIISTAIIIGYTRLNSKI